MIALIARFEVAKRLRMFSTYVYFALFFALSFLLMISAAGAFKSVSVGMGSGGKVYSNSPYSLNQFITIFSYFGLLVISALTGQAVHQDYEAGISPLFFTTPVKKGSYLAGRFLGALLVLLLIFSSIGLGLSLGSKMPFLEETMILKRAGFWPYLQPYLVSVIPNLFICGALFFSMATLTRRMVPVYVASVILLVGNLVAGQLTSKLENKTLAALLDPFGSAAIDRVAEYWSITEKNSLTVPLQGVFLWNRLIWLGVAAALLLLTFARFRFAHSSGAEGGRAKAVDESEERAGAELPKGLIIRPPNGWQLLPGMTRLALRETLKNTYFLIIVLCGVLFMVAISRSGGSLFGTSTYPVTYQILETAAGSFTLFVLILITFYAGELVWRERDARIDQLLDTMPIPSWSPLLAKTLALIGMCAVLMGVIFVTGLGLQTFQGYFRYEPGLYLKELFGFSLVRYALLCVLAMTIQTVVNDKYVGHFIMVLYWLLNIFTARFGFEHHLYRFAGTPGHIISDMNGFGDLWQALAVFDLYWAAFAVALAVGSNLFWVRGLETQVAVRARLARARFGGTSRAILFGSLALFASVGAFAFYNTNVLNEYRTRYEREKQLAAFERTYKPMAALPQPRITDTRIDVDIYPAERRMRARGNYQLKNKTDQPMESVFVNVPAPPVKIALLSIGAQTAAAQTDEKQGVRIFKLDPPLPAGASIALKFDLSFESRGFDNANAGSTVVGNGTFVNSFLFPRLGYPEDAELTDDAERKKLGLAPKERMADLDDVKARQRNYVSKDADWTTFEAVVSTSQDQLAVAPGRLLEEWTENGRRYFHYKVDGPVFHFFTVLSARYEVVKDKWNDVDIEIDYHKGHEYNVTRMIKAVKASLDYFTREFGPYQHKMVRILEFPRFAQFAQSFANTIPFSESIGFIAKVDPKDEEDVDYPYYVTSHEVAHQWWGHQEVGADVQGATLLVETLSQYSALMVMKKEYGPERMKRFLRYELQRYLTARSFERKKELPLYRVENQQYIHYNKGSLAMYALQDYLGEETLNRALRSFLAQWKFKGPPYPRSVDLIAEIRKVTPPEYQHVITDLFETITLFDNRATAAVATRRADGKYDVKISVSAKKLRVTGVGEETEIPLEEQVDIGAVDDKGHLIALERRPLTKAESEYTLVVATLPAKAGVDPLNKLIDRKPDDNLTTVTK